MGSGSERTLSNEIEEDEDDLFDFDFRRPIAIVKEEAKVDMGSAQLQPGDHDKVYVAVGKNHWSMDALLWTLNNLTKPSTFVHLIHVFPEVRYIPTPLGNVPKGQVKTEMVEAYVNQVRMYRRGLLQKFLDTCSAFKVASFALK
ncbi:PREDICTED: uncharacterized protein LOC104585855 [Nelumbo nucifera]|uniref:Uncharacterized protein LOC104585855 n=1 Tax=Nelumbo nucifera TaxID=4432 RepID=A0A1U8QBH0_NELNU|nr:PREDICTED: uncharacterized protein LOC104585855 [Nelumbo nucifera]